MLDRERSDAESDRRRFDFKRYMPSALRSQDKSVSLRLNQYLFELLTYVFFLSSNHLLFY